MMLYSVSLVCIRVLKIYIRLFGEKDGRVGVAMCSLAQVKCAKGIILSHKKALNHLYTTCQTLLDQVSGVVCVNDVLLQLILSRRGERGN